MIVAWLKPATILFHTCCHLVACSSTMFLQSSLTEVRQDQWSLLAEAQTCCRIWIERLIRKD